MKRLIICLSAAGWIAAGMAYAQQEAAAQAAGVETSTAARPGFHLYSASLFGSYYSNGLPANFTTQLVNLQSDVAYGAALGMGWSKTGSKLTVNVRYTPSYMGRVRYSDLHSLGQDLMANANLQLSSKWSINLNLMGRLADMQRAMFSGSAAGSIASTPSDYNSLSAALVSGQYTNQQLGAILTSPIGNSPLAPVLYGNEYLTVGLFSGVTYSHSDRLHVVFGAGGSRSQSISQTISSTIPSAVPVLPQMSNVTLHATAFYGLTPRLTLRGQWNASKSFQYRQGSTSYANSLIQTTQASLGYLAGTNWLFSVGGGVGFLPAFSYTSGGNVTQLNRRLTYLSNGSVAYKFYSQTLMARVSRTATNAYGFGAVNSLMGDLGWSWSRPGSGWGIVVDGGYQSVSGLQSLGTALTGWRGTTTVRRMLSRRLALSADYALLRSTGSYASINYAMTRSAAQATLMWFFNDQTGPLQ